MNPIEQVNGYLRNLERRLRWNAATRGAALLATGALVATLALVAWSNSQAFSDTSIRISRLLLFVVIAFAAAFGLVLPLLSLNRGRAAKRAEERIPEFRQRLLTYTEREAAADPFAELLASDTLEIAATSDSSRVASPRLMAASASAAVVSFGVLLWLILAGPGFLGHGASLLWAGTPRNGMSAAFYEILVQPGNQSVRRNSDQTIKAQTVGFQAERATLFAKYRSASKWEPVVMLREAGGAAHEFVFAALPDTVDYYVEANGVRSRTHTLTVVDLPAVKKLRVTYAYPSWVGVKNAVEDPGGDLRAVAGTNATVEVLTDKPLSGGVLMLDDGTRVDLKAGDGNWLRAQLPIQKNGTYHIAAILKNNEDVRLTEDYFIEAQNEEPPTIKIARPSRDAKVLPIEEVTIAVEAKDDFGLQEVAVHYSVNGGPEKQVSIARAKGAKEADGQTLIALEDYNLQPGDIVAVYATAKDARNTTRSDITFIEAQPYEREYTQSQLMGGGGGGGGEEGQDAQITQRQKEIIAATFNQLKDRSKDKAQKQENARYLADVQRKLSDQAKSMARRMQARQLSGSNQEFQNFTKEMDAAAAEMTKAADKLKTGDFEQALPSEQKGLQHLTRADALRKQIQIAYSRGGGGGGGGGGRDLENLFDMELDTEKNTYETGESAAAQRQQQVDETLQRLEQLARRQQELAQQAQRQQGPQTKWQQEMLRREAERLQEQIRQLAQQQQQQGGRSQSGAQGQRGGQSSQQQSAMNSAMGEVSRATQDMRSGNSADARRAADRLREAVDQLKNLRREQSGTSLDDLARRAEQLVQGQRAFADKARQPGQTSEALGGEKERLAEQLRQLENDMQRASRNMAGTQRGASNKLREALGESQGSQLQSRMKMMSEYYKRGLGSYVNNREAGITQGVERLSQQVGEARQGLGGDKDPKNGRVEQALNQLERLRAQLSGAGRQGQGQRGQQQGQQPGQEGQQGQQGQQGQGQNGQRPGNQPGQQPGQQSGQQGQGGQRGGNQQGEQGGDQQGQGMRGQETGGNGARTGDDGYGVRDFYRGQSVPSQGPVVEGRAGLDRAIRQLSEIRQGLQDSPDTAQNVQEIIRAMQRLNPAGNPRVLEQMRAELLPQIEQLETKLRRELEGDQPQNVRAAGAERVAPAYRDAVAEYYRRLSKVK